MIKCILLDVHGVITAGDERKKFLALMKEKYGMNYDDHNELWIKHLKELDTGKETASQYMKEVNRTFNTKFSVKEYYSIFLMQIHPNKELLDALGNINDMKIYIISDNFPPISSGLNKIFGVDFKHYKKYFSYKTGKTKSDPGLFDYVLEDLHIKAEDCIFIDDNEKNIKMAENNGIKSILFKDTKQTIEKLSELL